MAQDSTQVLEEFRKHASPAVMAWLNLPASSRPPLWESIVTNTISPKKIGDLVLAKKTWLCDKVSAEAALILFSLRATGAIPTPPDYVCWGREIGVR